MTTDNVSQQSPPLTAGERLRHARESVGLTVAEVADRQHLRPAVIKAIENGDYRQIDSELFLKGYVRTYAGQVGLDPDSVIRQLDRELEPLREEQKAQVEANPLVSIARRKQRKRQIARVVGFLILMAAVFYSVSLYLASQQAAETEMPTEQAETAAGDQESPVLQEQATPLGGDEGGNAVEGDEEASTGLSPSTPGADDADMNPPAESGSLASGSAGSEAAPDSAASEPASGPGGEGSEVSTTIVSQPLDESPAAAQSTQEGLLQVAFSDDCWIEVQDHSGRTIEASLRSAGDTLELNGQAPIRVVLGAVNAVESLSYSGEAVNLSNRRVSNNRLVLTLP